MSHLEMLHKKYADMGLVIMGLNTETNRDNPEKFARGRISFPVLLGAGATFTEYRIHAIPTLVYIDRDGDVSYTETDFSEGKLGEVEAKTKELLGL
jgi:hypothetical protein